jgi:hypothetical protein
MLESRIKLLHSQAAAVPPITVGFTRYTKVLGKWLEINSATCK